MTEDFSNFDLDKEKSTDEDKIEKLEEFMKEIVKKFEDKTFCLENEIKRLNNELKKEKSKKEKSIHKINKLINKGKALPLELLDDLLKTFVDRLFLYNWQAINILSSSFLVYELAKKIFKKQMMFKYVENKWKYITSKCCFNNCVNTDSPNDFCIIGNGFGQIKSNTDIVYINCRINGNNKIAKISSENNFTKPIDELIKTFTFYYFENKLIFEENGWIFIGLRNGNDYIYLSPKNELIKYSFPNSKKIIKLPSFTYKINDIIGCGLVYPPPNMTNKLPYIFFTQNGKQIGKAILIEKDYELFKPCVSLRCCSIETNFGNNPFIYDITKHYILEVFYEEREFLNGN